MRSEGFIFLEANNPDGHANDGNKWNKWQCAETCCAYQDA
jgi:hypothetical protein